MTAGHGTYSNCQPLIGFSPSWFAVIAVEKIRLGILVLLRVQAELVAVEAIVAFAPALRATSTSGTDGFYFFAAGVALGAFHGTVSTTMTRESKSTRTR